MFPATSTPCMQPPPVLGDHQQAHWLPSGVTAVFTLDFEIVDGKAVKRTQVLPSGFPSKPALCRPKLEVRRHRIACQPQPMEVEATNAWCAWPGRDQHSAMSAERSCTCF